MIRRPPRSTLDRSSAASDVYKRQAYKLGKTRLDLNNQTVEELTKVDGISKGLAEKIIEFTTTAVSYTHLRAHETVLDLVCRLLLEKKTQHSH